MRIITTMLIGSALACNVACRRQETGGAPGPTAKTEVLVRCHFIGTLALANNTNSYGGATTVSGGTLQVSADADSSSLGTNP